MKLVKNFIYAVLLASILAVSAFAGDQGTPGYANPTPSPTPDGMTYAETTLPYDCDPNAGSVTTETSDYLFYEALAALLSVY